MTTSRILAVLGWTRCRNAPGKTCFTPRGLWADLLFTPRLITISLSYTTLVKSLPNHIILFHPVSNSDASQLLKIKGQDSSISKMDSTPFTKTRWIMLLLIVSIVPFGPLALNPLFRWEPDLPIISPQSLGSTDSRFYSWFHDTYRGKDPVWVQKLTTFSFGTLFLQHFRASQDIAWHASLIIFLSNSEVPPQVLETKYTSQNNKFWINVSNKIIIFSSKNARGSHVFCIFLSVNIWHT